MIDDINFVTVKELGRRLKLVRQKLGLSQTDVAKEINSTQLTISKAERGENILSSSFLAILVFYSKSVNVDILLGKHFDPADENLMSKNFSASSIIKQKLLLLKQDFDRQMEELKSRCDEQMDNSIDLL